MVRLRLQKRLKRLAPIVPQPPHRHEVLQLIAWQRSPRSQGLALLTRCDIHATRVLLPQSPACGDDDNVCWCRPRARGERRCCCRMARPASRPDIDQVLVLCASRCKHCCSGFEFVAVPSCAQHSCLL